jgi:hypothetical protein
MFSIRKWRRLVAVILPALFVSSAFAYVVDDEDDIPDITARVARISYVEDDVQVRRAGSNDWEKAATNLPLVEGDEIATTNFAKLEIQFDSRTYVRIAERSLVKITTLSDSGIALSLPQGSMSIRVYDFSKDRSYFEVDIPNSTIAIQRSGVYRIDTGDKDSYEAKVRVTEGGEARIYSDTSGFTLKNDRAATIYLSGNRAGEWDPFDASAFADSFDTWTTDRDKVIAKRLRDAYYDKYYDRDIYGAEDLTDYGEWVYSRTYGYVWRPYGASIQPYADWSPYRYGQWRWLDPYGWTWVNDEPWGWATYHYGRWVWDVNRWVWTPYGYYRPHRSWWRPALVVINIWSNNVCWYPLGYYGRYHDYNHHRRGGGGSWGGNNNGGNNNGPHPSPSPTIDPNTTAQINEQRRRNEHTPTMQRGGVPPGGVVMTSTEEWGRSRGGIQRPPLDVAKTIAGKDPESSEGTPIILPTFEQVKPRMTKEVRAEGPPIAVIDQKVKTGASERIGNKPLDDDLQRTRMYGNRPRLEVQNPAPPVTTTGTERVDPNGQPQETRKTGAVNRPPAQRPIERQEKTTPPIIAPPTTENKRAEPPPQKEERRVDQPRIDPPRREPPARTETPKYEPPPRREEPRVEPKPRSEPPRVEPKPRSEPPPQKSEPKVDKPSSPAPTKKGNA